MSLNLAWVSSGLIKSTIIKSSTQFPTLAMKFANISSSLILFVSSTNATSINNQFDEQVARSYLRTEPETKTTTKSSRCKGSPFNGNELLCNDYAAAVKDDRYDFTYEGAESMYGAKVMSGINPLPDHLKDMFEVEQHFPNPSSNFIGTLNAVGMHPGLGAGTFGERLVYVNQLGILHCFIERTN